MCMNEQVKVFFEMLDDELKKVDQFYTDKESEFLERGELLNKQLQILLDLKRVLSDRRRKNLAPKMGGDSGFLSMPNSPSDFSGESLCLKERCIIRICSRFC